MHDHAQGMPLRLADPAGSGRREISVKIAIALANEVPALSLVAVHTIRRKQ
jgi:hypothetical protein